MSDWLDRPRVESTLLNPALIGLTVAYAASGYRQEADEQMTWPLCFLVPPIVLHRPTREALPRDLRTHFATWIDRNPLLVAGFPRRAAAMRDLTREGVRMAVRTSTLDFSGTTVHARGLRPPPQGELGQLLRSATLVGRWFTRLEQPSSVFAMLGVRP